MLRIVCSTLSLVGSGRHSIASAIYGSQRVGGYNPVLTCSPTVTCSPKTETKVVKKFKRKTSIPNQFCLNKNDNFQMNQYIEMSYGLNPSTCSSLFIFMYFACEIHTFSATLTDRLQQHAEPSPRKFSTGGFAVLQRGLTL